MDYSIIQKLSKLEYFSFFFLFLIISIFIHELSHFLVAYFFNLNPYFNFSLISFKVNLLNSGTSFQLFLVSLFGPLSNLFLYLSALLLTSSFFSKISSSLFSIFSYFSKKEIYYINLFAKINLYFFIINILPFPGFDGFQILRHLFNFLA